MSKIPNESILVMSERVRQSHVQDIKSKSEFLVLCVAWRGMTRSSHYEGTYEGKGRYEVTGYDNEVGRPVAVIRRVGDLTRPSGAPGKRRQPNGSEAQIRSKAVTQDR